MMRPTILLLMLVTWGAAFGQSPPPSESDLTRRVKILTAAQYAGRGSGSAAAGQVAALLTSWLKEAGLQPAFGNSWHQDFDLKGEGWTGNSLLGRQGRNVAGLLPGQGDLADRYLVIGAHYDHLGRLDPALDATLPAPDAYYPGANDNASGISVLFELMGMARARAAAADSGVGRRSLLFVCFDGEEVGLQGSGYMAGHMPVPLSQVDAMLNFDTVGQLTDNRLHVSGVGTASPLTDLVTAANRQGLDLSLAQGGWSGSDHMSFNTREVPVLFIFGGPYLQYNTPGDTWDTVRSGDMSLVAAYADGLLGLLAQRPATLTWLMVAGKNLRPDDGAEDQNRNTWLGTLPDFTEDIQGYKLAGVFDGSPAALGGLGKGDVLTRLGGRTVTDLATFTRALRSFSPGDLVEITVLRDTHPLNFTIVLGDRQDRK